MLVPAPSLAAGAPAPAAESFCIDGCPAGAPADNTEITHHILVLSNNPHTKFADWVAYKVVPETISGKCKRHWAQDPDLPADTTLAPHAYDSAHADNAYDRGHLAPLAALCGSPYWPEADYMSNVTPQKTDLNRGTWNQLENAVRDYVKKRGTAGPVYVQTGPLYEQPMPPAAPDEDAAHHAFRILEGNCGRDLWQAGSRRLHHAADTQQKSALLRAADGHYGYRKKDPPAAVSGFAGQRQTDPDAKQRRFVQGARLPRSGFILIRVQGPRGAARPVLRTCA